MAKILIKNGRVFDGESFLYSDILTDGEVVSKIERNITDAADFTFDATGMTVSAGLVDIHTHISGVSCDKFGMQGDLATIPFGVTAAADASAELGSPAVTDAFAVKMLVFAKTLVENNHLKRDFTEEILKKYGERAVGVKLYFDTNSPDVKDATPLREVCEYARELGLSVMVHSSNSPCSMTELVSHLSKGDILTHAFHGGKNTALDNGFEALAVARERGVIVDVGFAGHVHTDFRVLGEAIARGVLPDVISTDITNLSAYKRGGRYGMTMCMSIARALGMSEDDIFRAVTSSAASALKMGDEWGHLRVGRRADIAVIDFTDQPFSLTDGAGNTVKSDKGYRCMLTVADGRVVYRH
jgi:dihydroorotase